MIVSTMANTLARTSETIILAYAIVFVYLHTLWYTPNIVLTARITAKSTKELAIKKSLFLMITELLGINAAKKYNRFIKEKQPISTHKTISFRLVPLKRFLIFIGICTPF